MRMITETLKSQEICSLDLDYRRKCKEIASTMIQLGRIMKKITKRSVIIGIIITNIICCNNSKRTTKTLLLFLRIIRNKNNSPQ